MLILHLELRLGTALILGGRPISTATRRSDDEDIAGPHLDLREVQKPLYPPVHPLDPVLADCAGLAAVQAKRAVATPVAQDGSSHRFQEAHPPDPTVAAPPTSGASGACPNLIGLEAHRKPELQDFRIRQPRIGHVC